VIRRYLGALSLSGERNQALQTYESFRRTLLKALDSEPEDATLRLLEQISPHELSPRRDAPSASANRRGRQGRPAGPPRLPPPPQARA
jgi:DNA-binding SARP family transcriptional activator